MPRKKNDGKGRLGGRAKGTPNKVTATTKEWLTDLINRNREQIETDLKQLEAKDRLQMLEKLMQYVVPKQQAMTASIDFERLTDEQLDEFVNHLTKDIDDEQSANE